MQHSTQGLDESGEGPALWPDTEGRGQTLAVKGRPAYRGTGLLSSAFDRFLRSLVPVAVLWLLTGWAIGWW